MSLQTMSLHSSQTTPVILVSNREGLQEVSRMIEAKGRRVRIISSSDFDVKVPLLQGDAKLGAPSSAVAFSLFGVDDFSSSDALSAAFARAKRLRRSNAESFLLFILSGSDGSGQRSVSPLMASRITSFQESMSQLDFQEECLASSAPDSHPPSSSCLVIPTEPGEGILDTIQSIIQGLDTNRQGRVRESLLAKKRVQSETPEPVRRFLDSALTSSFPPSASASSSTEESLVRQQLTLESLGNLKSIAIFCSTAAATEIGVCAVGSDLTHSCMDTLLPLQTKEVVALAASLGPLPPSTIDVISLSREPDCNGAEDEAALLAEEDFFAGFF